MAARFRDNHKIGRATLLALLFAAVGSALLHLAQAQNVASSTTLYAFAGTDGSFPEGGLVLGSDGNLYGTTFGGGASGNGTVFVITPAGVLTTLHSFNGLDGSGPVASLVQGPDSNFYGMTEDGGDGTVFRVTPAGGFTVLHTFEGNDSSGPQAGLVLGSDGNLYGSSGSTVFRITPAGEYTVLASFAEGLYSQGSLVFGRDGNLYGTTDEGVDNVYGTVFQLTPAGVLTTLHSFNGNDGMEPTGLVLGSDGNLYGTTRNGGAYGYGSGNGGDGTIYRITPTGEFTVLHNFDGTDGLFPYAAMVLGRDGNFYGTTYQTVFEITPAGDYMVLDFFDDAGEGMLGSLVQGSGESFYGTQNSNDTSSNGRIFALTVGPPPSSFFTGEQALGNDVYYLTLPNGNLFSYYSYLEDFHYIYHYGLHYEYIFDANDGQDGIYLYDFQSGGFFYTSPTFPFPYLYDFSLNSVVYYFVNPYPPGSPADVTGTRYFYVFNLGQIITK